MTGLGLVYFLANLIAKKVTEFLTLQLINVLLLEMFNFMNLISLITFVLLYTKLPFIFLPLILSFMILLLILFILYGFFSTMVNYFLQLIHHLPTHLLLLLLLHILQLIMLQTSVPSLLHLIYVFLGNVPILSYNDYKCNIVALSSELTQHWCNLVSFYSFPTTHKAFISTTCDIKEPVKFGLKLCNLNYIS